MVTILRQAKRNNKADIKKQIIVVMLGGITTAAWCGWWFLVGVKYLKGI